MRIEFAIAAMLLAQLGCGATGGPKTSAAPAEALGEALPHPIAGASGPAVGEIALRTIDGDLFSVAGKVEEGKVVMLSFWATWCGPCKTELERMEPVFDRLEDEGFLYVAISTDSAESVADVRPYIHSTGYTYPVLLDTTGEVLARFNPRGDLPFYVLINRKGQVVEAHQGFKPGDEVEIERKVRALLEVK